MQEICSSASGKLLVTVEQAVLQAGLGVDAPVAAVAMVLGKREEGATRDSQSGNAPGSLAEVFATVADPRREHLKVYPLAAVLLVAVAAMLCGAKSVFAIGQWAAEVYKKEPQLLEALGIAAGRCPSGSTFHRVLKSVAAAALTKVVGQWLGQAKTGGESYAVDGKTERGTIRGEEEPGVHLVAAYAGQAEAVVAQKACEGKGQELPTGREVIAQLPIAGNLITGDALFAQRDLCQHIVDRGGDYLFVVKGSQPALLQSIARAFADLPLDPTPKLSPRVGDWFEQKRAGLRPGPLLSEKLPDPLLPEPLQRRLGRQGVQVTAYLDAPCKMAHGRFERREVWAMYNPELNRHAGEAGEVGEAWPHLRQAAYIKRERVTADRSSVTISYVITSLPPEAADAERIAREVRGHWGIENRLHYVRDVTLGEDASQIRAGAAPEVMATLRNLVIALARHSGADNIASGLRALGWCRREAVALVLQARAADWG